MITKETFIEYIEQYKNFERTVENIAKAFGEKRTYSSLIWESEFVEAVNKMLDIFLCTNFDVGQSDLIYWFLFEDVDHTIYTQNKEFHLDTLEDLYNYIINEYDPEQ